MSDDINRCETTYIDLASKNGKCTTQWLLENRNLKGKATHPITNNNKITMFICGKDGFDNIAKEIKNAKKSIDLCCWGFDPGMELVREQGSWPRGETYGDMLISAGRRGVKVRLLVWFDWYAKQAGSVNNMPGFTHENAVWRIDGWQEKISINISAENSILALRKELKNSAPHNENMVSALAALGIYRKLKEEDVALLARREYCFSWYRAAFSNFLTNVEVRTHTGDTKSIKRQLAGGGESTARYRALFY
ncbi:phospholipase D-like domain-containing protein [Pseudoduganella dura]|uniref:phospholipase D-like domain-containing protein n=1 Tax=Pseudoduganella dura TaxID=321982 RepID=UPI0019C9318E|nr:hypothetical protein [Pseudoduganella dura]GGX92717.1 hypothetical protein GCM10007386_24530 [Pseudoduganella dura]